eukprot:COSAG06_NODE_44_length_29699_cov_231.744527_18_plen_233_part_00
MVPLRAGATGGSSATDSRPAAAGDDQRHGCAQQGSGSSDGGRQEADRPASVALLPDPHASSGQQRAPGGSQCCHSPGGLACRCRGRRSTCTRWQAQPAAGRRAAAARAASLTWVAGAVAAGGAALPGPRKRRLIADRPHACGRTDSDPCTAEFRLLIWNLELGLAKAGTKKKGRGSHVALLPRPELELEPRCYRRYRPCTTSKPKCSASRLSSRWRRPLAPPECAPPTNSPP